MAICQWVTMSRSYFQIATTPIYVKPMDNFFLLRLDYMGFYFPAILFHKFAFFKAILTTPLRTDTNEYQVAKGETVTMVDLTADFQACARVERLDFSKMPILMFFLLTGEMTEIRAYKELYEPLLPFLEFVGTDPMFLGLMK